jgi:uncharacterized protein YbjQ (UPF0145 family)
MITTTTNHIEGETISRYCGIVSAEVIMGANLVRDFMAEVSDTFGGRAGSYERKFDEAKRTALDLMISKAKRFQASAIIGVSFSYQALGDRNSILMVAVTGTAVIFAGAKSTALHQPKSTTPNNIVVMLDGCEMGPYDNTEIASLYSDGTITDDTEASVANADGTKKWVKLGTILGQ